MNANPILYWISRWINHPTYFVFCFTIGLFVWSFSFDTVKAPEQVVLSSFAANIQEIKKHEEAVIERLPTSTDFKPNSKLPKRFRSNPAFKIFEKIKEVTD